MTCVTRLLLNVVNMINGYDGVYNKFTIKNHISLLSVVYSVDDASCLCVTVYTGGNVRG